MTLSAAEVFAMRLRDQGFQPVVAKRPGAGPAVCPEHEERIALLAAREHPADPEDRKSTAWTAEEEATLREHHAEGLAALARTESAISTRANKLGLRRPWEAGKVRVEYWTEAEDACLREHLADGATAIGVRLGRTTAAVLGRWKRLGLGRVRR